MARARSTSGIGIEDTAGGGGAAGSAPTRAAGGPGRLPHDGGRVPPLNSTPRRSTDTGMPVTSFRAPNRAGPSRTCPALVNEAPEVTGERRDLDVIADRDDGVALR